MKKVIFIGNRSNVLLELLKMNTHFQVKEIFALNNSSLVEKVNTLNIPHKIFHSTKTEKATIIDYLKNEEFDILVSNGCPFILPISEIKMKQPNALFINVHPSYLPHLKGKTPLNGVIALGYDFIGATAHYIDDGIDTGNIIYREKVDLTSEIDQGLIYYISFDLEGVVFRKAMGILLDHHFTYAGEKQMGKGSYFNRENYNFEVNFHEDGVLLICRKINALGINSIGNHLVPENSHKIKAIQAEPVKNDYLLEKFKHQSPGKVLHRYDDFVLIKTIDGIVKVRCKEIL